MDSRIVRIQLSDREMVIEVSRQDVDHWGECDPFEQHPIVIRIMEAMAEDFGLWGLGSDSE